MVYTKKLSYISNSCVKSTHHTVCWTNNGGNFPSQITCDKISYYIRKRRWVSRSNSDQATGWTTEESSFDSRQGQKIFLYSHSVQTSSGLSGHLLLRLWNINSPTTVCGFLTFAILFATKYAAWTAAARFCWYDPKLPSLISFTTSDFLLKNIHCVQSRDTGSCINLHILIDPSEALHSISHTAFSFFTNN
jgi:hypothetical protein